MKTYKSVGAIWVDASNAEIANKRVDAVLAYAKRHGVDISCDSITEEDTEDQNG